MKKAPQYLLLYLWFLFITIDLSAIESDAPQPMDSLQDHLISSFRNSLGFNLPTNNDSIILVQKDSLLNTLYFQKRYNSYFELSRIIIKAHLLRGETRIAIAQSTQMYSKAKALEHPLGKALSFNAFGEVYALTGRNAEAINAYQQALDFFDMQDQDDALIKILLIELSEYHLRNHNLNIAAEYIKRLNKYTDNELSETEECIFHIFNAYYQLRKGALEEAKLNLDKAVRLSSESLPSITQNLLIIKAYYLEETNNLEEALKTYNNFLETKFANKNSILYLNALKHKANLLVKMNRKEEAFKQYFQIYAYINSTFEKNYPKEIDQLCMQFQAEQLAYQNEHDRHLSIRYSTIGIILCLILLILFSIFSWRKIFRLKQSRIKQNKMKQEAENAIRKKNLFLSNMSHEVRTPLNAIIGFSNLLVSEEIETDEESQRDFCKIIKTNSYQLLELINDIIDFSDFEDDNIKFHIKQHDAVNICKEIIETVGATHRQQNVTLSFNTELQELMLDTDDGRLRQVLINLLVNATKFTQEGSIILRLELDESKGNALFSVMDTGCGVPPEKQKIIFERFEKLNDSVQGTGLGLSICQLIINHVNGKIWLDKNYTQGACFCFTHPLTYQPIH